jgi:hypothetical protein
MSAATLNIMKNGSDITIRLWSIVNGDRLYAPLTAIAHQYELLRLIHLHPQNKSEALITVAMRERSFRTSRLSGRKRRTDAKRSG